MGRLTIPLLRGLRRVVCAWVVFAARLRRCPLTLWRRSPMMLSGADASPLAVTAVVVEAPVRVRGAAAAARALDQPTTSLETADSWRETRA